MEEACTESLVIRTLCTPEHRMKRVLEKSKRVSDASRISRKHVYQSETRFGFSETRFVQRFPHASVRITDRGLDPGGTFPATLSQTRVLRETRGLTTLLFEIP